VNGYLLDTNVISELKRAKPDENVSAFIAREPLERFYLSVVTFAEYVLASSFWLMLRGDQI
jgi:predicted nucleic acid-binding protein